MHFEKFNQDEKAIRLNKASFHNSVYLKGIRLILNMSDHHDLKTNHGNNYSTDLF